MHQKPKILDTAILSFFVILITLHPFFLHGKINLFETGLYLPGIDAILRGLVPYRDFFYLRGPFELYIPALLMSLFGAHLGILSAYFYFGTVLSLILCVFIAKELYQTRFILYVMVPVLIARTFPRVVFTYWGGVRYVFGLLVLYCVIRFFKKENAFWLFLAGIFSSCCLLISVEIGVCAVPAVIFVLLLSYLTKTKHIQSVLKGTQYYLFGLVIILFPYLIYLATTHSFFAFVESMYAVVFKSHKTFATYLTSTSPKTAVQFVLAMLPWNRNFKYMTPSYFYLIFFIYIFIKVKNKKMNNDLLSACGISVYGLILYFAAFRIIEGAQFETALQPEKILFFYLIETVYLFFYKQNKVLVPLIRSSIAIKDSRFSSLLRRYACSVFILALVVSSLGFSLYKYNKRFFVFKAVRGIITGRGMDSAKPFRETESRPLTIERAKGIIVSNEQADELEAVVGFIDRNTSLNESVFVYPDRGAYSFLFNRPFLGRFPTAFFSWMENKWHKELMQDLRERKPKYAVVSRELPPDFQEVYFTSGKNKQYFDEVMNFINKNYTLALNTVSSKIFTLRN